MSDDPRVKLVKLSEIEPLAHGYELAPGKAYIVVVEYDVSEQQIQHFQDQIHRMGGNAVVVVSPAQLVIFGLETKDGAAVLGGDDEIESEPGR